MPNATSSDEQAHSYFLSVTIGGIGTATFGAIILY